MSGDCDEGGHGSPTSLEAALERAHERGRIWMEENPNIDPRALDAAMKAYYDSHNTYPESDARDVMAAILTYNAALAKAEGRV